MPTWLSFASNLKQHTVLRDYGPIKTGDTTWENDIAIIVMYVFILHSFHLRILVTIQTWKTKNQKENKTNTNLPMHERTVCNIKDKIKEMD